MCDDAKDKGRLNVSITDIFSHTSSFTEHVQHRVRHSYNDEVLIRVYVCCSNISVNTYNLGKFKTRVLLLEFYLSVPKHISNYVINKHYA